jgi:serine/threonine protein kinase
MDKAWFIQSRQGNIKDCYFFEKKLGSGGYGAVYLAKNKVTGKCNSDNTLLSRLQGRGQGHAEEQDLGLRLIPQRNYYPHAAGKPSRAKPCRITPTSSSCTRLGKPKEFAF